MRRFVGPILVLTALAAHAQTVAVRALITQPVDNAQLRTLPGNTHPLARPQFDQGVAPGGLPTEHMLLVLNRSAEQETALEGLLQEQQDKSSPQYHKWLTPQQFGQQFGPADRDIQTITAWLESQGFTVNRVSNGRNVIDFSGTASQVAQAFHTEIHKYVVNGQEHWANASDPQIPVALAPVIAGVATLHNFNKKPQIVPSNRQFEASLAASSQRPQFTSSDGAYALSPGDYAIIYNINPLYQANITGTGTVIAVVGRTDIKVSDVTQFRSVFNLSSNDPQIVLNGTDPGNLGGDEEAEAVLDTSWAGATAPGATVKLVVSQTTNTTDGVDLSEEYIVDNNFGDVMTESFGDCEADYTQSEGNFYSSLAQQAAAQGITYTVAAGDSGAEGCDDPSETTAAGPLSVNILASTPYTVAVGGTEFNENGNYSAYWNSTNGAGGVSALSYIPEDVWNESCTDGQCTNGNTPGLWSGGGGASTLFSKPSWQVGVPGIPNDGARDVPDVSLTAAGHDAYLLCLDGSCTPNRRGRISFQGYSGTSAATPSFAGIMALVVQQTGARQGQADYTLYSLAAAEALGQCNASNTGGLPAASCIFNDVTVGNNAVPGEPGYGTSSGSYQAGVGYDLATGLGSVNAANLVRQWPQFRIVLDAPGPAATTFVGVSVFSGWALSNKAKTTTVEISVDGVPYGPASYSLYRPDVCAVYPGSPDCPNVGWSISVDTTQIPDGPHTLDVTATSGGQSATVSGSFTVANWTTADPMRINIDNPNTQSGAFSGMVAFGGWAVDNAAISSVSISVDGVPYGKAAYGGNRPDVCAVYPSAGCPNVGWNFSLNTTLLPDGIHTLAVSGTTIDNQSATVTTSFTVSNASGNPFKISIDRPNTQSGPFSGPATFGGWAISSLSAIARVAVSIDGMSYGNAIYGGNRPDVCAVFPAAGCPNVGWNFLIDTTQFANGPHAIEVAAYALNAATQTLQASTVSSSFTVANPTVGIPMKIFVDQPSANTSIQTGATAFSGWALDDNGVIAKVEILIDGVSHGNATYGINRPDVCNVYPGRRGCPKVGWTFPIDTDLIPDGTHTLDVTGTSSAGDRYTVTTTFTVANWTTGNPMKISIDTPGSQSGSFSGTVAFGGWAIDDIAAIGNVAVSVDGVSFGNAAYGGSRPDVCAIFPGIAGCPNVGWNVSIDTTQLSDGAHTLEVTATSSSGQNTTSTASFTVANLAASGAVIDIDRPALNETLSGLVSIGGWSIDTNSGVGIAGIQILVDGVSHGAAVYGGNRPDVCAIFGNEAGCPNVGWNAALDTTLLANGIHTLDVEATSMDGHRATLGSSFYVDDNRQ